MSPAQHQKKSPVKSTSRASAKKATPPPSLWRRHERDLWIVLLVVAGLFCLLADAQALGPVGHVALDGFKLALGEGRWVLPVVFIGSAVALLWNKIDADRNRFLWGSALSLVSICGISHLAGGRPGLHGGVTLLGHAGGWLGVLVGGGLYRSIGLGGALIVLVALLIVALMVITGFGLRSLGSGVARAVRALVGSLARWWTARPRSRVQPRENAPTPRVEVSPDLAHEPAPVSTPFAVEEEPPFDDEYDVPDEDLAYEGDFGEPELAPHHDAQLGALPELLVSEWVLPPLSLLQRTKEQRQDRAAVEASGSELVDALRAHGVETTLVGYTVGPTVTRYELELGSGVKVSRLTSLNRDIAYAMATPDVRILAPIPGRSAIGVEVPNRHRTLVALGDLLSSEEALAAGHPLDVPIGRDIAGRTVVFNLGEMPHVLISGATGAGKSSCINSLITSLVMRTTPEQLRLLLVDPKRVEMGQYNDLPHLLAPVVVDPKKAANILGWAVKEMERRYDLLAQSGARDITSYQQMIARGEIAHEPTSHELVANIVEQATGLETELDGAGPEQLPYIVIVVDELNDLMMVAARDVEESVVRIAQMARAVGIHLVLATQRPSVDVITGVIKANIPSRMAFAVSSLADSRVILDQAGAERLIGKGDMLLVTASSNIARRLQSPWVSEDEVRRVVEFWRAQGGRPETVVALDVPAHHAGSTHGGDDDDEILRQARELVIRHQSGSTSMLQRKLRIGFARAGRIMDQLEEEGVVAAGDGSKARKVLRTPEEYGQQTSL
ncbi:MAG: DNA translocase FtsK 4TM domain-containing protein [Acidimicrobiales bacterium]